MEVNIWKASQPPMLSVWELDCLDQLHTPVERECFWHAKCTVEATRRPVYDEDGDLMADAGFIQAVKAVYDPLLAKARERVARGLPPVEGDPPSRCEPAPVLYSARELMALDTREDWEQFLRRLYGPVDHPMKEQVIAWELQDACGPVEDGGDEEAAVQAQAAVPEQPSPGADAVAKAQQDIAALQAIFGLDQVRVEGAAAPAAPTQGVPAHDPAEVALSVPAAQQQGTALGAEDASSRAEASHAPVATTGQPAGMPEEGSQSPFPAPAVPFGAYEACTLETMALEAPPMVLHDLLTAGLSLLAGAPKKGKSWLALALALAVVEGKPFLGRPTMRGDVLYLDLESRQHRVKERIGALRDGPAAKGLHIAHKAPRMEQGLIEELQAFLQLHPDTRLIIVDTLARVKGQGSGRENVYEADTRMLGELQRFALEKGLCILMVHHLRKSSGNYREADVYERVSGSMGITGVCDCVLVLDGKRGEAEAQLHADGRDIPGARLALRFDRGRWELLSEDAEQYEQGRAYRDSPLPGALKALTAAGRWEGTAKELCEKLEELTGGRAEMKPESVYLELEKLRPLLETEAGLILSRSRKMDRRLIALTPAEPKVS